MDTIINGLYDALEGALNWLLDFMGFCPFNQLNLTLQGAETGLGWLNWFVPFHAIVSIMQLGAAAFVIYYAIRFVLNHTINKSS